MTTSARTADLAIGFQRVKLDAKLGTMTPQHMEFFASVALRLYAEASRWLAAAQYVGANGIAYVPDDQWKQVLAAMNKLYKLATETPIAQVAFMNLQLELFALMPPGFRGDASTSNVITTEGQNTVDVVLPTQNVETITQAQEQANAVPHLEEAESVIVLPTPSADQSALHVALEAALRTHGVRGPIDARCLDLLDNSVTPATAAAAVAGPRGMQSTEFRDCLVRGGATINTSWWATAPDTHKAGAVAAGVVSFLLLLKLAK